jgi:hypothetical protein
MDAQLSRTPNSLVFSPIFDFLEYFSCAIAGIEFESLSKRDRDMESARIPDNRYHQFGGLYRLRFPVSHRFFKCQPDSLVIRLERKPRLIQKYDVVPAAGVLCLDQL